MYQDEICWDSLKTASETVSRNPPGTLSGFGDVNQTRLHNLNQDKDIILVKRKITFMELWKLIELWKYYFHGLWKLEVFWKYF